METIKTTQKKKNKKMIANRKTLNTDIYKCHKPYFNIYLFDVFKKNRVPSLTLLYYIFNHMVRPT